MRVYEVFSIVNEYQYFMIDSDYREAHRYLLDGTPKLATWEEPPVFIYKPLLKRGNFADMWGLFSPALDEHAVDELRELLEMSGELLPLTHQGENWSILNVTECVNMLDDERSKWVYGETTGAKIQIAKYVFHASRVTESPLFKIPEMRKTQILTIEGFKDPEDEFKYRVEQAGLTGLKFKLLWSDDIEEDE